MTFTSPVRDIMHALSVVGANELFHLSAFRELDKETAEAILAAGGTFMEERLAPLNHLGDIYGARYENGAVLMAPGFATAFKEFAQGGWCGLTADPAFGGQGLPKALELAVYETMHAANLAFGLLPVLNVGAIEALQAAGTEAQKARYLPALVEGRWTSTMSITEPQAGSDLSTIITRATPGENGGYKLDGEKIFITWGDHDGAENVIHLVLARLPDAPPGVKGISLFLAPKFGVDEKGLSGDKNKLRAASIEHKLGLRASPTCVMLFEGAEAELIGKPNQGLAQMFVMMNAARLQVGVQGVGIAERAYQAALAFALERRQGRAALATENPARIIDHPDVRRSLMFMKSQVEAGRLICLLAGVCLDRANHAEDPDDQKSAQARADLLTPIAKAWATDMAVAVTSAGIQIHGGMGFIEETGAAQYYRDVRITPIYEGTNAIQANDLVGRKLSDGGAAAFQLIAEIRSSALSARDDNTFAPIAARLDRAATALENATRWILSHKGVDVLAGASTYLSLFGDVLAGWLLLRSALTANDTPWGRTKAGIAALFSEQCLLLAEGKAEVVTTGGNTIASVDLEGLRP